MPLYWNIDSLEQLVTVTADGDIGRVDADEYLDAVDGGAAIAYRKLVDGRAGTVVMGPDDLMAVGVRIRSYHHKPVGALALVLSSDQSEQVARILGILASADRPMRIFASVPAAQRWIESLTPPRTADAPS